MFDFNFSILNSIVDKFHATFMLDASKNIRYTVLNDIYSELIDCVNSFPRYSPKFYLKIFQGPPYYQLEAFSSVIQSLDIQIEHYSNRLKYPYLSDMELNALREYILERSIARRNINDIEGRYYIAKEKYEKFLRENTAKLELHANPKVLWCLENFNVAVHNAFISGNAKDDIENERNLLKAALRKDINKTVILG